MWQRYNAKLALQDAAVALGYNRFKIVDMTRELPDEFDKMEYASAVEEFPQFAEFAKEYPDVCELAYGMTGKIKAQGKHAGGLIISSVPIKDYVPLTLCGTDPNKQWTSAWIEGMAATQLSKFGFIKFDILGLLNLAFIFRCRELIQKSKDQDILWMDLDPRTDSAGWIENADGSREKIRLNDPETLKAADELKLHSIFQFDTDFAMSVVQKGGVKSFMDLVIYTSLGRPGPMPMIDVYIENRDRGEDHWKPQLHPIMQDILGPTQGVLCIDSKTLVRTCSGKDKRIEELKAGDSVVSYNSKIRKFSNDLVIKVGQTRQEDGLKIRTDDNREIIVTYDHEFILYDGTIRTASELKLDDLVPIPTKHLWNWNNESIKKYDYNGTDNDWGYLLGYLIGDGLLEQTSPTICCGNSHEYALMLNEWLVKTFNFQTSIYFHCRSWYIRLCDNHPIKYCQFFEIESYINNQEWWENSYKLMPVSMIANRLNKSTWWIYEKLKEFNIKLENKRRVNSRSRIKLILEEHKINCNVYNKRIPDWIYNSNAEVASFFLAGLLDSDGCITSSDNYNLLSIVSCNSELINDISKLLDILEIDHNYQQDRIFIWNHETFMKIIERSYKFKNWKNLNKCTGNYLGWYPRSDLLSFATKLEKPKRVLDKENLLYRGHWRSKSKFCKTNTAKKLGIDFGDVRFQKIVSIEKIPQRTFYGIEVENNHTLIGNGIVVHNCFQEQLLRTWTELCGFTMPEAEKLQKAVKKKKGDFLEQMSPRVIKGAALHLGQEEAEALWDKMISFGRYCFNQSHAVAYIVIAYRCLWLKTHYPAEWWAAVLSFCPNYKFGKFISAARTEGIEFGSIDVQKISVDYTVDGDKILPGLSSLKGIGKSTAEEIVKITEDQPFRSLDDFVERYGKAKGILERIIKLGGFEELYKNRKALWSWYLFCHGSGKDITLLRRQAKWCYVWDASKIEEERRRQITEYQRQYPKRKKIPKKILNWVPTTSRKEPRKFDPEFVPNKEQLRLINKMKLSFEEFVALFPEDYNYGEQLVFEKEYLGYYWSSPLGMYKYNKKYDIEGAKKLGMLDTVIEEVIEKEGARGPYKVLNVTDGTRNARVNAWTDALEHNDEEVFEVGMGVRMQVKFQEKWNSFSIERNTFVIPLAMKDEEELVAV